MNTPLKKAGLGLMVGALGVVYGDIGTSPLYAISEAFFGHYPLTATPENIYGVLSLVFWSLVLVVTIKYVGLILRTDNKGEGGIFALLGLLLNRERKPETGKSAIPSWLRAGFISTILIGAALIYGDGMITPAISVLSAVEGLSIVAPTAQNIQIPITIGILLILFAMQKRGTHRVGRLFGPIMILWFLAIGSLGLVQVFEQPEIMNSLNPYYAFLLAAHHGWHVLFVFGAVVLCVTGVEAMYADLGHFGRAAIARGWYFMVFPCLLLNYLGQGAYLLSGQSVPNKHLFYALSQGHLLIPMVILATAATIIASQAMISGAFSLTQQAIALGIFPRLKIVHTNPNIPGQIYIPFINNALLVGCIALVVVFKSSSALAAAYGLAVTGTMIVTALAFTVISTTILHRPKRYILSIIIPVFILEAIFFSSNMLKFTQGGYVPIIIGALVFAVMDTWRWGRKYIGRIYTEKLKHHHLLVQTVLEDKVKYFDQNPSVSLVVMSSRPITSPLDRVPPVLAVHYRNWRRLPKHIIFLSIIQLETPTVNPEERYETKAFSQDQFGTVVSAQARFGYMEQPDVRTVLSELKSKKLIKLPLDPSRWLILIGIERFVTPGRNRFEQLRIRLFSRINRMAKPVTDYFGLESDPGVTMETINI